MLMKLVSAAAAAILAGPLGLRRGAAAAVGKGNDARGRPGASQNPRQGV